MPAAIFDIVIEQGAVYERIFSWDDLSGNPIDMTGWTARMQIRPELTSDTVLSDLSTENVGITLNYGTLGAIRIFISTRETNSFNWSAGVYDLEVYDPSFECYRILKGKVKIDPQVTRVHPMTFGNFIVVTDLPVAHITG